MSNLSSAGLSQLAKACVNKGVLCEVFQSSGLLNGQTPDTQLGYFQEQLQKIEEERFRLAAQVLGGALPEGYEDDNNREGVFNGLYSRVQIVRQIQALDDEDAAQSVSKQLVANAPATPRDAARFMVDRGILANHFKAAGVVNGEIAPEWADLLARMDAIENERIALAIQLASSGTSLEMFKDDDKKAGFYNGMYSRMLIAREANGELSRAELAQAIKERYSNYEYNIA